MDRSWASSGSFASIRAPSPAIRSSSWATTASLSRSGTCSCSRAGRMSEIDSAVPGDIAAVAKVDEIGFDCVLHDSHDEDQIHMRPLEFPTPMQGVALAPKKRGDEQRIWEVLHRMTAEDPTLVVEHDPNSNETVLSRAGRAAPALGAGAHVDAVQAGDRDAASPDSLIARRSRRRRRDSIATRSRPAARGQSEKCRCASSHGRVAAGSSSSTRPRAGSSRINSCRRCARASSRSSRRVAIADFRCTTCGS